MDDEERLLLRKGDIVLDECIGDEDIPAFFLLLFLSSRLFLYFVFNDFQNGHLSSFRSQYGLSFFSGSLLRSTLQLVVISSKNRKFSIGYSTILSRLSGVMEEKR